MNRLLRALALSLCLVAVACAFGRPKEQGGGPTSTAGNTTARLKIADDADPADMPWFIAIDALTDQGYAVQTVSLSWDLVAEALAQGDVDMAPLNNQSGWAAIAEGAPFVNFMDLSANTLMVVSPVWVRTCADLDGEPVAVTSLTSVGWALFNSFLQDNCPGAEPDILLVKGGENRMAALLSGEVAASMQDTDELVRLERDRPGEFHPLIVYATAFPQVNLSSFSVRREFAEQHPEMVKDTVRSILAARRTLQDPDVFRDAMVRYMDLEDSEAQEMADAYLAQGIWDLGGGYTLESVQTTMDFLQEFGSLTPELEASDVADFSYYEAVLDEIGRP